LIKFLLILVEILFAVGFLGTFFANRGLDNPTKVARWKKFWVYYLIVHVMFACILAGKSAFLALICVIVLKGIAEIISVWAKQNKENQRPAVIIGVLLVYLILAAGLIAFSILTKREEKIFVFMVVCIFDGFSQIVGQLTGRHHFLPNISPGKTIEGAIGGILSASFIAIALGNYLALPINHIAVAGFVLAFSGLAGDMAASWYKRLNGVKDFGNILPGHGGVLDRFDSFIVCACSYLIFRILFKM
jgi:phosphatidate cytidylyltransferase